MFEITLILNKVKDWIKKELRKIVEIDNHKKA
jgi:hypothetical protein